MIDFDHAEIKPVPDHSDEFGIRVGFRSLIQMLRNLKYSLTVTQSVSGIDRTAFSKQKTLMRLVDDKGVALRRVNSLPKLNDTDSWQDAMDADGRHPYSDSHLPQHEHPLHARSASSPTGEPTHRPEPMNGTKSLNSGSHSLDEQVDESDGIEANMD